MRPVRGRLDPEGRNLIPCSWERDGGGRGATSYRAGTLAIDGEPLRGGTSLDEVAALVDWAELDALLADISASARGELGWPPLALFRALLLATWHDLSDVRLAEALDDRASFRRFCGFATHEPTPERTTFVRFRAALCAAGWTEHCSRWSRASSTPAAWWCAPAPWWTRHCFRRQASGATEKHVGRYSYKAHVATD